MYSVVETPIFQKQAAIFWSEDERLEFIAYISSNPLDGAVIAGADGARKIRWGRSGKGKRGGVRVIYFNVLNDGYVVLIAIYAKSETESISAKQIKEL